MLSAGPECPRRAQMENEFKTICCEWLEFMESLPGDTRFTIESAMKLCEVVQKTRKALAENPEPSIDSFDALQVAESSADRPDTYR
jgi:hypothetical protein